MPDDEGQEAPAADEAGAEADEAADEEAVDDPAKEADAAAEPADGAIVKAKAKGPVPAPRLVTMRRGISPDLLFPSNAVGELTLLPLHLGFKGPSC